jgi:D-glycero-D-manno-heptose 1,7-bisphosphate phosphatase
MTPCVFFDRDGVINTAPPPEMYYVLRVEDFHIQDGFIEALRLVRARGYEAVVVTNQKCVARGLITLEALRLIHDHLRTVLAEEGLSLTDIMVCPHGDDVCSCRKPKPGMLLEAAERHQLDLGRSWMIGDSPRDMEAGRAAGCRTVFVGRPGPGVGPDHVLPSMREAPAFLAEHLS